jgi:hypothetical protein
VTILDFQIDEPTTIHEALIGSKGENWKETLESEYDETYQNIVFGGGQLRQFHDMCVKYTTPKGVTFYFWCLGFMF